MWYQMQNNCTQVYKNVAIKKIRVVSAFASFVVIMTRWNMMIKCKKQLNLSKQTKKGAKFCLLTNFCVSQTNTFQLYWFFYNTNSKCYTKTFLEHQFLKERVQAGDRGSKCKTNGGYQSIHFSIISVLSASLICFSWKTKLPYDLWSRFF